MRFQNLTLDNNWGPVPYFTEGQTLATAPATRNQKPRFRPKQLSEAIMIVTIYYYSINENVEGQEQQPTNNTDNLEIIIQQNQIIIQQNDEAAIQDRAGAYIGIIALLISLPLVIYGFQLSREGRITQKTKRHYRIIILSLVVPVFILIPVAWFTIEEFLYPYYYIMTSLLLIPGLIVIIIMFRNIIVGDAQPTGTYE